MISIIVAVAENGVIGGDNRLLWHISEDLKHFKAVTTGHPVVMGRKTYESIGRPLPGRQNIVLTRDPSWTAEGVDVIHSVEELKRLPLMDPEVMVIGGAEIFSLMMPLMSRMWVSHISGEYPADTWLPPFEDRFRSANLHEQFEGFDLFLYE
jgi:dihydrofolate reductase